MKINGINGANTQMGQMGMNQATDSYSRNIQRKISQKASAISNAAARIKGVDKTYNKNGAYSDTISKLFQSTIDERVGSKDKDKDKVTDKFSRVYGKNRRCARMLTVLTMLHQLQVGVGGMKHELLRHKKL